MPSAPRKSAAVATCHTGRQDDWREWEMNMKMVLIQRKRSKKDIVKFLTTFVFSEYHEQFRVESLR